MSNQNTAILGKIEEARNEVIKLECRHAEAVVLLDAFDTVRGIESKWNAGRLLSFKEAVSVLAESNEIPEEREANPDEIRTDLLHLEGGRRIRAEDAAKRPERTQIESVRSNRTMDQRPIGKVRNA